MTPIIDLDNYIVRGAPMMTGKWGTTKEFGILVGGGALMTLFWNGSPGWFRFDSLRTTGGVGELAAADIDGDGGDDVVYNDEWNHLVWVSGRLDIADLNGDGRLDIAAGAGSASHAVRVFPGVLPAPTN